MNIIIEDANIEDIPTMLRWGQNTRELWGDDSGAWYEENDLRDWINNPGEDFILVARDGEKLAGMCFAYQMRGWAYCDMLYVDAPYRGRGIGTKFLDEVESRTKQKSTVLGLFVKQDNEIAQAVYKKRGFEYGFKLFYMFKKIK